MVVASVSGLHQHVSLSLGQLLQSGEIVAIVDDDAAIREPLRYYFAEHGLPVAECASAAELMQVMASRNVALVILDIGLPDTDGLSLLPQIVEKYPDAAVVMLTGVADLRVALDCMRKGATDYLSKPVQFEEIFYVARKALEKRRLIFENRKYQEELEEAHSRMQLLHQLSVKMNTVYLSTGELDQILRTVLVGITSQEGLGFNRAFLVMFDEDGRFLRGRMAIGPSSREEAGRVWEEIEKRKLDFLQIVDNLKETNTTQDAMVNNIARALVVSVEDKENLLICAALRRRSYKVAPENGWVPVLIERRGRNSDDKLKTWAMTHRHRVKAEEVVPAVAVPRDLINILDEDYFVVVPLYSPGRSFGVIIADNYVTRMGIEASHISALELFASQASLAIEQSLLHNERQRKIAELEAVNQELDRSKDLLVEAERYSALGHMAAQLVHIIRNPITSIGGVSRILDKKNIDPEWTKYLNVIIHETERVEAILEDLFDFVKQGEIHKEALSLGAVIEKTALLLQTSMVKNGVTWEMEGADPELIIQGDMHQIRQMFIILFKNAIEAMSDGGRLSIILAAAEGQASVSVIDNGPGIPESYLDKVKDPFFTTKTYGTGMGLTLVERIVSNHGGSFSLKPHPGGGLEVRVMLPLQ
ncbi:MAG TPA: two-component system sensor histidine kinase/response regulator [Desulfobulbaceae bacterium]|nr:MAG: two-component system sensor histidine kinase/response regulator [Deltaproteobacteria bacterium RIFOXYD12_FULL_53_23]HCC54400.1 two-component system sensor histidine kinase/response regulator [Desulfobulbaceae bacterium]